MMPDSSSSVVSTNIRKNFPKHKALHISKSHARLLQLMTTLPDLRATEYRGHTRAIIQLVSWSFCAYSGCIEGGDLTVLWVDLLHDTGMVLGSTYTPVQVCQGPMQAWLHHHTARDCAPSATSSRASKTYEYLSAKNFEFIVLRMHDCIEQK